MYAVHPTTGIYINVDPISLLPEFCGLELSTSVILAFTHFFKNLSAFLFYFVYLFVLGAIFESGGFEESQL